MNRYYWPSLGRYVQPDPLDISSMNTDPVLRNYRSEYFDYIEGPLNQNAYIYTLNNPLLLSDRFGFNVIPVPDKNTGEMALWPNSNVQAGLQCVERCIEKKNFIGNIYLTSGFRGPERNERKGGKPKSQHLTGNASDFYSVDVSLDTLLNIALQQCGFTWGYVNKPKGVVHADMRNGGKPSECACQ